MKHKTPKQIEAIVQDYYTNPIICFAFGIDYYNREEERDKEIIRGYVKRFYLKEEKKHD